MADGESARALWAGDVQQSGNPSHTAPSFEPVGGGAEFSRTLLTQDCRVPRRVNENSEAVSVPFEQDNESLEVEPAHEAETEQSWKFVPSR